MVLLKISTKKMDLCCTLQSRTNDARYMELNWIELERFFLLFLRIRLNTQAECLIITSRRIDVGFGKIRSIHQIGISLCLVQFTMQQIDRSINQLIIIHQIGMTLRLVAIYHSTDWSTDQLALAHSYDFCSTMQLGSLVFPYRGDRLLVHHMITISAVC